MEIKFSKKELNANDINNKRTNFHILYLYAIKNSNPKVWEQLVTVVNNIDKSDIKEVA